MRLRLLARHLLVMVALALGAGSVQAQAPGSGSMPATCKVPAGATLATLEARKDTLQREIARATGQGARKTQEQLLEVLFQIDCLQAVEPPVARAPARRGVAPSPPAAAPAPPRPAAPAAQPAPRSVDGTRSAAPRAPAAPAASPAPPPPVGATRSVGTPVAAGAPSPAASVIEVNTYYATSRKPTASTEPKTIYGPEVASTLHYGRAVVSIPPNHVPGNLELPTLWKLEREEDPNKHFVLKSVTPLANDAARKEMADKLKGMSSKALLVFVHGYNMTFADAALRTAQLAHDLRFPGMAFFYAWPSAAQILGYWRDEEMAQLSEVVFDRLIDELSALPVTDIYVIAHSMGSRIVTGTLRTRVDRSKDTQKVRELLLAAPDINAELFRTVVAPQLAAMKSMRTTVYASSADLALRASKVVHGFQRVGETGGEIFIYPGFETIDASSASLMSRSYGHSYLMDSSSVLRDIRAIVEQKFAAKQRGLKEIGIQPNQYWFLQ